MEDSSCRTELKTVDPQFFIFLRLKHLSKNLVGEKVYVSYSPYFRDLISTLCSNSSLEISSAQNKLCTENVQKIYFEVDEMYIEQKCRS